VNAKEQVVGLKVRRDKPIDEDDRYVTVSSRAYGGPGARQRVHVPLCALGSGVDVGIVRITEGELKADVATALSSVLTIAVPGVAAWPLALSELQRIAAFSGQKIHEVRIAFDGDARTNPHVARPAAELLKRLQADDHGYQVAIETWAEEQKGVDDALAAGAKITPYRGREAQRVISEILHRAGVVEDGEAIQVLLDSVTTEVDVDQLYSAAVISLLARANAIEVALLIKKVRAICPSLDVKDLRDVIRAARKDYEQQQQQVSQDRDYLQTFSVEDRNTGSLTEEAMAYIAATDIPLSLFRRRQSGVRITQEGRVEDLGPAELRHELNERANWRKGTKLGSVPEEIVQHVLGGGALGWKGFPEIEDVRRWPFLAPNGQIVTAPGYHKNWKTYLALDPLLDWAVEIPGKPRSEEVHWARWLIERELLGQYRYADESGLANTYAMALTAAIVPALNGAPTPLGLVTAGSAGSGKSMLSKIIAAIWEGREPQIISMGVSPEKFLEHLHSIMLRSPAHVIIDNIPPRGLKSPELAAYTTAPYVSVRVLGSSRQVEVPVRWTWLATGNNVDLSGELARRTVQVRIVPHHAIGATVPEDYWEKKKLVKWALEQRPYLVRALLTLVQHWIACGCPKGKVQLGSYEEWSEIIGGILDAAGIEGFLADRDPARLLASSTELSDWHALVARWWAAHGGKVVSASDLLPLVGDLETLAPDTRNTDRSQAMALSSTLRQYRGAPINGYCIEVKERTSTSPHGYRLKEMALGENPIAAERRVRARG
jgi:hypothetical protein